MVPIQKTVRWCIDFRRLNKVTTPDPYQMPWVNDQLDEVAGASWLLRTGFLLSGTPTAGWPAKDCLLLPMGEFQFTRMPFRLRIAPATFQRGMDEVLGEQADYILIT